MTETAVSSAFAPALLSDRRSVGFAGKLSAFLFGAPDARAAHGGYRSAFVGRSEKRSRRGDDAHHTPIFHIDRKQLSGKDGLPKIWLSERIADAGSADAPGRAFTSYYPSDPDKGGRKALDLAERFFAEGIDARDGSLRIQCFQAAEMLYMHSMRRGNLHACTRLGVLYRFDMCRGSYMKDVLFKRGRHAKVLSARETAFKLFRKAASRGDAEAMVQLGEMLMEGCGCARNEELAFKFFKSALKRCTGMEYRYIENSVVDAGTRARVHTALTDDLANASNAGNAALRIAEAFEGGRGANQSFEMARRWYEVAHDALSVSFDHGFWYSKRNKCKARQGFLRALQEINGKY